MDKEPIELGEAQKKPRPSPITTFPMPYLGGDPEMFFEKGGEIIESKEVIGKLNPHFTRAYHNYLKTDGVQVEMNLAPQTCRVSLGTGIRGLMASLKGIEQTSGAKSSFSQLIEIPEDRLATFSAEARQLGCAPSNNIYKSTATVTVDPTYRTRTAGGHIHLGITNCRNLGSNPTRLVGILDLMVGNTCVLIDRDPGQIERRKVYGRAGEYRLPSHGLEYRTLSNFWLRSFPLTSMVFGLARMALGCEAEHRSDELLAEVDKEQLVAAINLNDLELAQKNYAIFRKWIEENVSDHFEPAQDYTPALQPSSLKDFDFFISKPLDYWFAPDPIANWLGVDPNRGPEATINISWERYLSTHVRSFRRIESERIKAEQTILKKLAKLEGDGKG